MRLSGSNPGCGDSFVEAALTARHADRGEQWRDTTRLFDEKVANEVLDSEDFEHDDIVEEFQRLMEAKAAKAKQDVHRHELLAKHFSSRSGGSAASDSASSSSRPRKFVPLKTDGYTGANAKQFAPPNSSISKDTREHRWRATTADGSTKSKSYGPKSGMTDYQAMTFVLRHSWRISTESTGMSCPWDFEAGDLVVPEA